METTDDYRVFDKYKCHLFYSNLRRIQTVKNVKRLKKKYAPSLDHYRTMNVWDALYLLNDLVDASDPDTDIPNLFHAFQTALGAKAQGAPEWMQLIGLIHDLGKIMYTHPLSCDEDGTSIATQFAVVGDTFPVGCRLSDGLVLSKYNTLNEDTFNEKYSR